MKYVIIQRPHLDTYEGLTMRLNHFNLHQKFWLLIAPVLLYMLLLTAIIIFQLYQQAQWNNFIISVVILPTLLVATFMIWFTSLIKQSLNPVLTHVQNLAENKLDAEIKSSGSDEFSQLLEFAAKIQTQLRDNQQVIYHYQRLMEELKRVFSALANGNINENLKAEYSGDLNTLKIDVNDALNQLRNAIDDIKNATEFASKGNLEQRIDISDKKGFLKNLAENINQNLNINQLLVEELNDVLRGLSAGNLNQTVQGHYSGDLQKVKQNANDSVAQLNSVMMEMKNVIDAFANGILDKRIDLEAKSGFFRELAKNLNHSLDVNQNIIVEVTRVFAAISAGDLTQTISGSYSGTLVQLTQDVNNSINRLNEVMGQIRDVVNAAGQGSLDSRIPQEGKQGFFLDISKNLNRSLDSNQKMVKELMRVFAAMALGDLTQTMNDNYQGSLDELKQDVNNSIARLNTLFEELMHVFAAMSGGDLTQVMRNNYDGRLAELKNDINNSVTRLDAVMAKIGQAVGMINDASSEVLRGNTSLSQRTEQQAAALEETASSMQEMTDTVQQNADNAEQANQLSISARKHAEEGGKVVNQAIVAMNEINKSSRKVSDIIGVIDEIAFQTNLLALNAAVEAARAGEQGRGFAVVATEVRNLAQRSAAAAKEIKSLIQDSVSKVEEGSTLVNQSGKTLEEIVVSVKKVSDIVAEIAAASREQSSGILQVNNAVTQMDEMTQQNASLVEELSGNSDSMLKQVNSLAELLSFFNFTVVQAEPMKTTRKTHDLHQKRKSLDELRELERQKEDSTQWENF
jgi:methyl-accepting chemotaxis protein